MSSVSEYQCKVCGGDMSGDGYTRTLICETIEDPPTDREADASPLYCELNDQLQNKSDSGAAVN